MPVPEQPSPMINADAEVLTALFSPAGRDDPQAVLRAADVPGCRYAVVNAVLRDRRFAPPALPAFISGEFLDTVIGIPDARPEIVMLRPPDGSARLELSSFDRPDHQPESPALMARSWGCATSLSRLTTPRPPSNGSPWTATGWSAASASTSTSGAWPTCADRKGSSWPWPSAPADAPVAIDDPFAPHTRAMTGGGKNRTGLSGAPTTA